MDLLFEANIRVDSDPATGSRSASVVWRYQDENNYYEMRLGSTSGNTGVGKKVNGTWTWLNQTGSFAYTAGTWYTASVQMVGSSISAYFWGGPYWTATDSSLTGTKVGLRTSSADVYFDNAKVQRLANPTPYGPVGSEEARPSANTTKYYYASGQRIAMRRAGTLSYLFSDHLGGTSVVSSTVSSQISLVSYYPFGGQRSSTGNLQTDRLFTGQRWESSTGLYDYVARLYDPSLGRFIQPDPLAQRQPRDIRAFVPLSVGFYEPSTIRQLSNWNRNRGRVSGQALVNPQLLNRYSYARNAPPNYVDSSGHFPDWIIDIVSVAFDIYTLATEPSWENAGYLGLDIVLGVVPFVPAVAGPGAKAAKAGKSGVEAMRVGKQAEKVAVEAYRAKHAGDTVIAGKAIRDEFGNTLKKAGIKDRNYFPDALAVNKTTGEVVEFKTGIQSEDAINAAKKQVSEYAKLLNDYSGYGVEFKPVVNWLDDAGNIIAVYPVP